MSFNFFHTKLFKVVFVVTLFGFLIFLNPYNFFNPVRSVFFAVFSPVQKVVHGLGIEFSEIKSFLFSIGQLKKENDELIKENQNLLAERAALKEVERENNILREEIDLLPRNKFNLEAAEVISQNSQREGDWVEINKGKRNGIEKDMPVIVGKGILIGKIEEVNFTTSKVVLLTNTQSSINSISPRTGAKGVVRGEYGLGIIMDMVLQGDNLNGGDEVVTSEIGKNIPSGLLIGNIQEIGSSSDRLFKKAVISSPVNFSRLEFVFVIKGNI